jgi:hypothetical protein
VLQAAGRGSPIHQVEDRLLRLSRFSSWEVSESEFPAEHRSDRGFQQPRLSKTSDQRDAAKANRLNVEDLSEDVKHRTELQVLPRQILEFLIGIVIAMLGL